MTYVSAMRTDIPEKLLKISDEIEAHGNANLTRLTVLKKWFDYSGRLPPFAIWVAGRASARKGRTGGQAAELLRQARALLAKVNPYVPKVDRLPFTALKRRGREN